MKKLFILLLVLAALLGGGFIILKNYTKSHSPEVETSAESPKITVKYCQPAKKGRLIFGEESAKALVPFGKVWRTGANEATLLQVEEDVLLGGQLLSAGKYSLWTIPDATEWQVVINKETGQWGTNYDPAQDVFRVKAPVQPLSTTKEALEITFVPDSLGTQLVLAWDNTRVAVAVRKK